MSELYMKENGFQYSTSICILLQQSDNSTSFCASLISLCTVVGTTTMQALSAIMQAVSTAMWTVSGTMHAVTAAMQAMSTATKAVERSKLAQEQLLLTL